MATVTALDSTNASGGTTCALNPSSRVNAGDFIVITVSQRDHTISSVADNSSQAGAANSYTLAVSQDDGTGDGKTAIYYCRVTRSILTTDAITITLATGGGTFFCALLKLDRIVSDSPLDQTGTTSSGGTSTWSVSTSGATTQADEIAIGVMNHWGSGAEPTNPAPDSPWVEAYEYINGGNGSDIAYRILTAAGTTTFSGAWSVTMDNDGSGCIATFKVANGAVYGRTAGSTGVNGASSGFFTVENNVVVGEKIVGMATCWEDLTLTVTDSGGNTYTVTKVRDGSSHTIFYFWADCTTALTGGVSTITFTYSALASWGCCTADVIVGAASGAPAGTQSNTGQLTPWSTTATATTNGSIVYGGSGYRSAAGTSTATNGIERKDFATGNIRLAVNSREIVTGGTHNVSGSWSDASGISSAAAHMVFAAVPANVFRQQAVLL